jgi:hypothetical protein
LLVASNGRPCQSGSQPGGSTQDSASPSRSRQLTQLCPSYGSTYRTRIPTDRKVKFLAIAVAGTLVAGWQPQYLPWGFPVVISGPFLTATVLIGWFPRSGTALLMVASAVLVAICVLYQVTPERTASSARMRFASILAM